MLKEVDKDTWLEEIALQDTSIFDQPNYLEAVSLIYHTKLKYWIIYKEHKSIIGFATHIKNRNIIVPNHYSYSSFWFNNDKVGDYSFFEYLQEALGILKANFKYVSFRLPPNIKDIRAFNLLNFSAKVNYTYQKNTKFETVFNYRKDTQLKLNKALKNNFEFHFNEFNEDALKQQVSDFQFFGFTKKQSKFYESYFELLIANGFLKSFTVFLNSKLVASALVIVDFKNLKAYNLLLSTSKENNKTEASTFLYDQMINFFKLNGFNFFDLYGADMKGIANYKAGFKGDLETHYTVSYSFVNKYVYSITHKLKKFIKSFI